MGEIIYKEKLTATSDDIFFAVIVIIVLIILIFLRLSDLASSIKILWLLYWILFALLVFPRSTVYYCTNGIKLTKGVGFGNIWIPLERVKRVSLVEFDIHRDFLLGTWIGRGGFKRVKRWPQNRWPKFLDTKKGILIEPVRGWKYLIGSKDPDEISKIIKDHYHGKINYNYDLNSDK